MFIEQTLRALDKYRDFVIGSARDGGYYLFGGRVPVDESVWSNVRYSAGTTCKELIIQLPTPAYELPSLTDVDTESDLAYVKQEMFIEPTKSQQEIMEWINEYEKECSVSMHW